MHEGLLEAGCDEAGRGCLAGAVYAAAVVLPPDFRSELLNDSKQLTERQRYDLRPLHRTRSIGLGDRRGHAAGNRPARTS